MKRNAVKLGAAVLCAALIFTLPSLAAVEKPWTRSEGAGGYVSVRLPCPEGEDLDWSDQRYLTARYADTGEPVALSSDYQRGYLFAALPAGEAERELEVFQGEAFHFADTVTVWQGREYYEEPQGTQQLYLRGIIRGDQAGNLNADAVLSRAEAFTLMSRLLSLKPAGDPGYADVSPGDWYYGAASAARAAGIAAADTAFDPSRPVTRGEFTVMLYRALRSVGWLDEITGTAADLTLVDARAIPDWALPAYLAFAPHGLGMTTSRDTQALDPSDGSPIQEYLAEQDKAATRGEIIEFIYSALRLLPCYPTQAAIDYGFDEAMPVVDGSTSTYPYTRAVYGALFHNYENHPRYPQAHSKSHASYERLIAGEVDLLFAATKPSAELERQAKAAGVKLEFIPIAYDAMVFFTNEENSVDGLTQKQIQEIYIENKYTNWNQVGGPDAALLPYRRNTDSGSHALMEQYFLEGGKLSLSPDVHNVYTSTAMTSALTDVAGALQADPPAYALGYSVYYYYKVMADMMEITPNRLKLLSVDGVMPDDASIADGSYPLAGNNYAVLRSDEPKDSPARRMVAFLLSEAGQHCVENAGFGPLSAHAQGK